MPWFKNLFGGEEFATLSGDDEYIRRSQDVQCARCQGVNTSSGEAGTSYQGACMNCGYPITFNW